ncbi:hypothetical protein [Gloeothece verrucosa]|uniref:Uncharacterized protein n=1 Tax=Gloeothece verrucosa (strain PCC 7822) TaxID=497965 RepID=E0UMN8_GLOV7|nr:hypothetical protein [Gloeothece verrucosa]ADN18218.1 hypothetical protein Cyan7822_6434 [Gloeothece verrucosa PCC 7822]
MQVLIFAAENNTAKDILENNAEVSGLVRQAFDDIWKTTIEGALYQEIAKIGALIGVFMIGLWAVSWMQSTFLNEGDPVKHWHRLLMPIFFVLLLSNPTNKGVLMGKMTLLLRDTQNYFSDELLHQLNDAIGKDTLNAAGVINLMKSITSDALQTCSAKQDEQKRNECFNTAAQRIKDLQVQYGGIAIVYGQDSVTGVAVEQIKKIQDAQGGDYATSQWFQRLFADLGGTVSPSAEKIATWLFYLIGAAFYWIIEISGICVAVLGPLALGMSLLPVPGRPIELWFAGFTGLGIVRLMYNIIVGLAAIIVVRAPSSASFIFPLIAGLFGPLMALAMGSWSGLSLFGLFTRLGSFLTAPLPLNFGKSK